MSDIKVDFQGNPILEDHRERITDILEERLQGKSYSELLSTGLRDFPTQFRVYNRDTRYHKSKPLLDPWTRERFFGWVFDLDFLLPTPNPALFVTNLPIEEVNDFIKSGFQIGEPKPGKYSRDELRKGGLVGLYKKLESSDG